MTISVVQSVATDSGPGGGKWSTTISAAGAGNTLVFCVFSYDSGATISASAPTYNGSAYAAASQLIAECSTSGGNVFCSIWMFPAVPGGGTSVGLTCTNGTIDGNVGSIAYEVSGLGASPVLDQQAGVNHTGGTSNVSSGTTPAITSAPEFVVGASVIFGVSETTASGFTNLFNKSGGFCQAGYQIPTSSGGTFAYAANTGITADWVAAIATISAGSAAAAGIPLVQRGGPTWRRFYRRVQRPLLGGGPAAVAVTSSGGLALSPLGMGAAALAGNIATGSLAMSPLAIAATDAETIGSSGSMRLASLGVGAQAAGGNNTSTGSLALKPLGMAGTAAQGVVATGSLALKPLGMAGTAAETFSSTGSLELNPLKMAGQGAGGNNTSTGSLKLNPLKMAGTGAETFTSTGSLKLQPLAVAGTGAGGAVTATGSLALKPLAMRGSGGGGDPGAPAAVTDDYRHRMRRRWQRRGW